jgi:hypothetical protein
MKRVIRDVLPTIICCQYAVHGERPEKRPAHTALFAQEHESEEVSDRNGSLSTQETYLNFFNGFEYAPTPD